VKLLLAVPTYGHLDPACERSVRVACFSAVTAGVEWVGDCSPDRMGHSAARNFVAQAAFDHPVAEGVVWVDADVRLPPEAIGYLVDAARRESADFVSGVYYERGDNVRPVFFKLQPDGKVMNYGRHPVGQLAPVDACGFGIVYTSKRMLKGMFEHPEFDPVRRRWFWNDQDRGGYSEDINFCLLAKKAGFRLLVHTGIQCHHQGDPAFYGREQFERRVG
jgi:glycosyltransferase involved in cell wall biosynthesis